MFETENLLECLSTRSSFEATNYTCPTVRNFYDTDETGGVALAVATLDEPGRLALFPGVFNDFCGLVGTVAHENLHVNGGGLHLSRSGDDFGPDWIDQTGLELQRLCEEQRQKDQLEDAVKKWRHSLVQ